ncbi:hypothetical protein V8E52_001301 [Russula decolorans]
MADDAFCTLICLVEGGSLLLKIEPKGSVDIFGLKELIWEKGKNSVLKNVDAVVLTLWKHLTGKDVPGSVSLERVFDKVSDHWLAPHNPSHLHIIVELPPADTSLRSNTVSILYEKLKKYHFILVRGTPASGKTTLAQLLAKHIRQQEPAVHVIPVYGWPLGEVNWQAHLLKHGWRQDKKTIFIFDEAQLSFEDFILWGEFFKELHNFDTPFAIAFASYGSPTTRFTIRGRPMFVGDLQRVALRAVDHGDDLGAVGLLFSRMEFDDLVRKRFSSSEYYFHQSFLDAVFRHTGGHVGAIDDFVRIVASDDSYRELKGSGRLYTWESFLKQVNLRDFFTRLETRGNIFARGLPSRDDLQRRPIARILSKVLCEDSIVESDPITEEDATALNDSEETYYIFASPLHRLFVEWRLQDSVPSIPFESSSILQLALEVIRGFSPRSLSAERRIGAGCIQRPPEAQYQDEFYRNCHACSKGSLVTFPEYGTAQGRIDFYIPSKEWGVELLRDGNELKKHTGRFSETGSYVTTLALSDYIILDFHNTRPKRTQPTMEKLYHVVFSKDHQEVSVLDHMLQIVDGGELRLLSSV